MDNLPASWPPLSGKLTRFLDIWQSLRDSDKPPFRHQLSLRHVRNLASWLVILERPEPGKLRVKVSGSNVDAIFGRSLTTTQLDDISAPGSSSAILQFHEALISHPCGGFAHDLMTTNTGQRINARYLILPLRDKTGENTMCASLWDAIAEGYNEPPMDHRTRMTHSELQYACYLDIGYGIPNFPDPAAYLQSRQVSESR